MRRAGLIAFLSLLLLAPPLRAAPPAAWQDGATGLAIGGFDPLSYFIDGEPRRGLPGLEYAWQGVVFRFVNPGNMAAFARHPSVYAPRFAGYDVYGVANGMAVEGEPALWTIHDGALYLFETAAHRDRWERDAPLVLPEARRRWPGVAATVPPIPMQ